MKVRKFVNDPAVLKEAGLQFVQSSNDRKTVYRATVVSLALGGISKKELSACCGESIGTINNWIKTADEKGFDALTPTSPPGRNSRLTEEQLSMLYKAVSSSAEDYGFRVWDGKSVSAYIEQQFNVSLGVRQCQNILKHKLNLSLIRPQTFPSKGKANEEERATFKKKS